MVPHLSRWHAWGARPDKRCSSCLFQCSLYGARACAFQGFHWGPPVETWPQISSCSKVFPVGCPTARAHKSNGLVLSREGTQAWWQVSRRCWLLPGRLHAWGFRPGREIPAASPQRVWILIFPLSNMRLPLCGRLFSLLFPFFWYIAGQKQGASSMLYL
jgi:hypothetical protein